MTQNTMMNNYNKLVIALLGGIGILVWGCVKESDLNGQYRPEGSPVVFSAGTGYDNGAPTRTEYSGELFGGSAATNAWERIDWVGGDPVTIYYRHPDNSYSHADYAVSGTPVSHAERSDAVIEVSGGNTALTWASGTGDHVFTAVYPTRGFNGNTSSRFNGVDVKGLIPSTPQLSRKNGKYLPDMSYATMVAYKSVSGNSSEQTVSLPFRPAFTAFEFRFRKTSGMPSFPVTAVSLTSTTDDLAGPFSFSITGGNERGATWGPVGQSGTGSRSKTITVSFGAGVTLSESADLDFTVLALPTDLTNLSLSITYADGSANGLTSTIALTEAGTGAPFTFTACRKYIISNYVTGTSDWEYVIEEVDDIVTYGHAAAALQVNGIRSYRRSTLDGSLQAVPWKAQYWDGFHWQDWNAATGGFSLDTYAAGTGVSAASASESRTVTLSANTVTEIPSMTAADLLRAAAPVTDYDLSLHDIHGNENPGGKRTTANTYVVSAPGTYLFPCVYGNAITNDRTNYESFAPGGANSSIKHIYNTYVATYYAKNGDVPLYRWPDVNYTPSFRNAINTGITNPYVIEDINANSGFGVTGENAVVVWQDAKIVSATPEVVALDGHKFIRFTIGADEILPGNVVIALRGNPGGDFTSAKTILWSWQIWVTPQDLHPVDKLMPANLGWNKGESGAEKYTDRSLSVRLVQILPSDDPAGSIDTEEFTVTQVGDSRSLADNVGSNPYYQWGRKDPMIPGIYSASATNFIGEHSVDKTVYPSPDYAGIGFYTTDVSVSTDNVQADYGKAIRHPDVPYAGLNTTTSWISGYLPGWTYLSDGQGGNGAGFAGVRSETAIPYNLWDAYCYTETVDVDGTHKVKTVYDPCPPGFAVPHKDLSSLPGSHTAASDGSGWYCAQSNGAAHFIPYTGARVYYSVNPNNTSVAMTPGIYISQMGGTGMFWTDCPLNIKTNTSYGANSWASLNSYKDYYYAYIFSIASSTSNTSHSTKGTAAAIRPMVYVDPNYQ